MPHNTSTSPSPPPPSLSKSTASATVQSTKSTSSNHDVGSIGNINGPTIPSHSPSVANTTTADPPLPRVATDAHALPVQKPNPSRPEDAAVTERVDSRTANADAARQRLLHSRFPSLSRIRSRKRIDDTTPLPQLPQPQQRRPSIVSSNSSDGNSAATPFATPRSTSEYSRTQSPARSYSPASGTNSAADKRHPTSSPDTSPSIRSTKPASAYSTDTTDQSSLAARSASKERAPVRTQSSTPQIQTKVTGNSANWSGTGTVNMHQTSSRLLRMTDDDRPFTRDFKDLFSTLMVSLPLVPHRVRFSKVEHTFTTEEAITNLGSLKFSQSNRMPDPKDPSRIVTTTTTTTFSMAKEMARSVCNKFLEARFVESCEGKTNFESKNSVWQLTPKGMRVLTRFCTRNGIHQRHVNELLDSPRNMMQLVILERDLDTDKINHDRAMIDVIFRRFAGESPNVKVSSSASDTDSVSEYATGLVGVRCIKSSKPTHKDCPYIFNGRAALDWLVDCCMVVDRRECLELANLFMMHDIINQVPEEKNLENKRFQPVKTSHYHITERGMKLAGWTRSPTASLSGDISQSKLAQNAGRDSNTNRMTVIIRDPALRLLFREFLIETHCEENLTFYLEVKQFLNDYGVAKRSSPPRLDLIRENLASAYSLYNAFLAPGSPCELNIDHNLRNALAGRMTRAVGEDAEMLGSLDEVAVLFDQAQTSVFKLMASDSVPKFSRDPKYATVLRDRNLEHLLTNFDRH